MGRRSEKKRKEKRKLQAHAKRMKKKEQVPLPPSSIPNTTECASSVCSPTCRSPLPSTTDSYSHSPTGSMPSVASPGSLPPSPIDTPVNSSSIKGVTELDTVIGVDSDAVRYELDIQYGFESSELGTTLLGEELTTYLKESNLKLTNKVRLYHQRCELLQKKLHASKHKYTSSIESIPNFYRNMLYYGTSQGAKMLKAASSYN